jgi:hypothetical protein
LFEVAFCASFTISLHKSTRSSQIFGSRPVWLSDSRRLLFRNQGKLYLIDSQSKKIHEVLSVAPHEFGIGVTLPRDDRLIYFSLLTTEADICLMTME